MLEGPLVIAAEQRYGRVGEVRYTLRWQEDGFAEDPAYLQSRDVSLHTRMVIFSLVKITPKSVDDSEKRSCETASDTSSRPNKHLSTRLPMLLQVRSKVASRFLRCRSVLEESTVAKFTFPNGGIGTIDVDLQNTGIFGLPYITLPRCTATNREATVEDAKLATGQEHVVVKTVTIHNHIAPTMWHRIDIVEAHTIRNTESTKTIKTWTKKSSKKIYTWKDQGSPNLPSEDHWSTYRHQLEQFVDKIKKREGSGRWMDHEDSIRQMSVIDSAYEKAGLPLRPSSKYQG